MPRHDVDYEKQGNVAVITINRPEARNAVNSDVAQGIEAAIDQIEADDEVWVGILTGARTGRATSSAPAPTSSRSTPTPAGMQTAKGGFGGIVQPRAHQADHRRRRRPRPRRRHRDRAGLRPGRGASTTAVFGIPEVKRNLVAAAGGLFRLPRKIPRNIAMELALTGRLDSPPSGPTTSAWSTG